MPKISNDEKCVLLALYSLIEDRDQQSSPITEDEISTIAIVTPRQIIRCLNGLASKRLILTEPTYHITNAGITNIRALLTHTDGQHWILKRKKPILESATA